MKAKLIRFFMLAGGTAILGGIFGVGVIVYFSFTLPKINSLNDYNPPIPSRILAKDGTILAELGREKRYLVEFDEIPPILVNSFLAAEDDNFWQHQGVDYMGVLRAMLANIKAGRVVQGGSTITQQVAKSLLLSSERSITRKIKDFLLAQRIEKKFSKKEILYLYLNQIYLGGGYYGVKSAIEGYYDKELSEVTVAEAAMIAGLLVAPGKYSPYVNPGASISRQRYVLKRLFDTEKINQEQYDQALAEEIKFKPRRSGEFKAGHFTDWVRQRVIAEVGKESFLLNGFTVQTTLDWNLQQVAEKEVKEGVRAIDKRQGFKGPLKNLESDEKIIEFVKKKREEFYKDSSQYFTIHKNKEIEYELELGDDELLNIADKRNEVAVEMNYSRVLPGYDSSDRMIDLLKHEELYEGVVLKTDNYARIVYVNVNGTIGIIPYEYFRWAHERNISESRQYYSYVTRPSTILKKGDVVWVSVLRKKTSLYRAATDEFRKQIDKKPDVKKAVLKERYLLCALEQKSDAEAALVSMNPFNGEIISFVGGKDFRISQFNRALQSHRQPGSSFKPILFAAGLENGYRPNDIIMDSPEALGGADESLNWKPRNYDGKFKGPMTFRNSLEQSRNVPTIKIAQKIGVQKIVDFVQRLGMTAELDRDLSLSLGSFGVTLMEMVQTYSVFPNGGKKIEPKSIVSISDRHGKEYILGEKAIEESEEDVPQQESTEEMISENEDEVEAEEPPPEKINPYLVALGGDQVYDPRLSYIMTNLLKGIVNNPGGTGRGAREVSTFLGGKTGTTNNFVDTWFLGFSAHVVTGVWTGFDDNGTLGWGETGAKSSLPIWKGYMRASIKRFGESEFRTPPGIIHVTIDKQTGELLKNPNSKNAFLESFVEGDEPKGEREKGLPASSDETYDSSQLLEDDDFLNEN